MVGEFTIIAATGTTMAVAQTVVTFSGNTTTVQVDAPPMNTNAINGPDYAALANQVLHLYVQDVLGVYFLRFDHRPAYRPGSVRGEHPLEARARARAVLEKVLSIEQLEGWDRERVVEIPSEKHRGRVYRITGRQRGEPRIEVYQDGEQQASVCLQVGEGFDHYELPPDDILAAKVLLCRYAEDEVGSVGNWSLTPAARGRNAGANFVVEVLA